MKRSTIYNTIKRYKKYKTTEDLLRSGRPVKLNNNQVAGLVRKINNKAGVSQRRFAKHYNVSQATISRTINKRTNIRKYKREKASKHSNDQQQRAQKNLWSTVPSNFKQLFHRYER
ncbi:unnamed protein product [Rotaria sordida]|uniref:HTH psq-type domain-containing protein n=1 Tax=Rotaria sordida TaxID=392033 RepID=A0A819H6D8_9BILA|nr:unnamed protein product [Rotaria sordida]CAF3890752.1 unnamed protein product [Rotaria sordida]